MQAIHSIKIGETEKPITEFSEDIQRLVGLINCANERRNVFLLDAELYERAISQLSSALASALEELQTLKAE